MPEGLDVNSPLGAVLFGGGLTLVAAALGAMLVLIGVKAGQGR